MEHKFPEFRAPITQQWNKIFVNWLKFHNHFTKDNLTCILTMREYEIARFSTRHVSYAEIAEQFHLSVNSIKKIMQTIYEKTSVNNREELSKLIL